MLHSQLRMNVFVFRGSSSIEYSYQILTLLHILPTQQIFAQLSLLIVIIDIACVLVHYLNEWFDDENDIDENDCNDCVDYVLNSLYCIASFDDIASGCKNYCSQELKIPLSRLSNYNPFIHIIFFFAVKIICIITLKLYRYQKKYQFLVTLSKITAYISKSFRIFSIHIAYIVSIQFLCLYW